MINKNILLSKHLIYIVTPLITKLPSVITIHNMTVYPFCFSSKEPDIYTMGHEDIHAVQWKECIAASVVIDTLPLLLMAWLITGHITMLTIVALLAWHWASFLLLYAAFYLKNLYQNRKDPDYKGSDAYFDIPFEKEAYQNAYTPSYLDKRPFFHWFKYIQ